MPEETVHKNNGEEFTLLCKHITGRRAFQVASKIFQINEVKTNKNGDTIAGCNFESAVDVCWDYIVEDSPQKNDVCAEDMQMIYDKYAKKDVEFAIKKNLENFNVTSKK